MHNLPKDVLRIFKALYLDQLLVSNGESAQVGKSLTKLGIRLPSLVQVNHPAHS
jgi:hypothetical protein